MGRPSRVASLDLKIAARDINGQVKKPFPLREPAAWKLGEGALLRVRRGSAKQSSLNKYWVISRKHHIRKQLADEKVHNGKKEQ